MDKEILEGFQQETNEILQDLAPLVSRLEDGEIVAYKEDLASFAQKIDRIMGAAQTLSMEDPNHQGLIRIGKISRLCKTLGYHAAESNAVQLIPFFAAFWAETLEVVEDLVATLEDEEKNKLVASQFSKVVEGRLAWLANKLTILKKTGTDKPITSIDVQNILKDLGL